MSGRGATYLDTNVFIAAFEGDGPLKAGLRTLIETAEGLTTSQLAYSEVAVRPLSTGDETLTGFYRSLLGTSGPNLEVRPIDLGVLHEAAMLRASSRSLKLPDAIHLATAVRTGCQRFLTFEARLQGVCLPTGGETLAIVVPTAETFQTLLDAITS